MAAGSWLVDYYPIGQSSITLSSPVNKHSPWQSDIFLRSSPAATLSEREGYGGIGWVTFPMFRTNGSKIKWYDFITSV